MARQLTELQKAFLDALFTPACNGDFVKAKKAAGYNSESSTMEIVRSLRDEIEEATKNYIAANAPKAAIGVVNVLDAPSMLGAQAKLSAAKEILDRVGIVKPEKVTVDHTGGVLLLPPKE